MPTGCTYRVAQLRQAECGQANWGGLRQPPCWVGGDDRDHVAHHRHVRYRQLNYFSSVTTDCFNASSALTLTVAEVGIETVG